MLRRLCSVAVVLAAVSACSNGPAASPYIPSMYAVPHQVASPAPLGPDACNAETVGGIDQVVAAQLAAFKDRDFARAFGLSSMQFQAISSVADLKALIDDGRHAEVLDSVGYQITDCRVAGPAQAMAAVQVTGSNGNTVSLAYQFVVEDGHWTILMSRPMGTPHGSSSPAATPAPVQSA